jgi:hypothetical protein
MHQHTGNKVYFSFHLHICVPTVQSCKSWVLAVGCTCARREPFVLFTQTAVAARPCPYPNGRSARFIYAYASSLRLQVESRVEIPLKTDEHFRSEPDLFISLFLAVEVLTILSF